MLDGLRPLDNLVDRERYMTAWWTSAFDDHETLDDAILAELEAIELGL